MFFVPFWWWLIWRGARGGQRFSLRHILARTLLSLVAGEAIVAGIIWAMRGERNAVVQAFRPAALIAAGVALLSTCEPLVHVARASFVEGRLATRVLKLTSIGFRVWCAFVCAMLVYVESPHLPALAHALGSMQAQGWWYGTLRFIVGATIAFIPVVWTAILSLEALDGFRFARPAPAGTPWRPPSSPPQATYIPPPAGPPRPPTPPPPRMQPPPRIVSTVVDGVRRDTPPPRR